MDGFLVETAFTHVLGKFPNVPCAIIEKNVTDEQYECIKNTIDSFINKTSGQKYDFVNLFLAKTPYVIKNNKYFCSEFVAYVLEVNGIKIPNIKEKIRPYQFMKLEGAKIIYKGELKEWCKLKGQIGDNP